MSRPHAAGGECGPAGCRDAQALHGRATRPVPRSRGLWASARASPARVALNARAHDLAVLLRGIDGTLPGARSVGVHASARWVFVVVTAAADEAVGALREGLGLACDVRIGERWWWRRAM